MTDKQAHVLSEYPQSQTTSLAHAVRWIAKGVRFLGYWNEQASGDHPSVNGEEFAGARKEILLALRHGKIRSTGNLDVFDQRFSMYRKHDRWREKAWNSYLSRFETEVRGTEDGCFFVGHTIEIPSKLWNVKYVHWNSNCLFCDDIQPLQARFRTVQLEADDLQRKFQSTVSDKAKLPEQNVVNRGRPQKYPWDDFFAEIAVIADLDGLPEAQADLEEMMKRWCLETWEKEPGESTIREKIAPIYRHRRKARKKQ